MEHNEFVVELSDGSRDWVDPVSHCVEAEDEIIVNNGICEYRYPKNTISKWTIRPYSPDTTYDPI